MESLGDSCERGSDVSYVGTFYAASASKGMGEGMRVRAYNRGLEWTPSSSARIER
jgi:hypothetical protein